MLMSLYLKFLLEFRNEAHNKASVAWATVGAELAKPNITSKAQGLAK